MGSVAAFPRPLSTVPVALDVLARAAGAAGGATGIQVRGVTLDSRGVQPGDLYAALPGSHAHGAEFTQDAVRRGAVALLTDDDGAQLAHASSEAPGIPVLVVPDPRAVLGNVAALVYGHPSSRLRTTGITGTNGKTTTAYLLDSALRSLSRRTGLIGTVETRILDERTKSVRTTPEAPDLHALLAVMAERGVQDATMEVSSHALALHRVDGVVYDLAVFTNLSQDHLDFHGGMEPYYAAKASLFTPERSRRAVVCVDDAWGRRLAHEAGVEVVTLASRPDVPADWRVCVDRVGDQTFTMHSREDSGLSRTRLRLRSALAGDFNRVNTALAAVALLLAGHPPADVERALAVEPHVPGRMEHVHGGRGEDAGPDAPLAVVDFAHTPDAVAAVLMALRERTRGSLVVVLGAGGDRDRRKRPFMGMAAARHADVVVVTDDNPRSEDPAAIRAAVLAGAHAAPEARASTVLEVPGRDHAIRAALEWARTEADTIVVVGKGHEIGQEVDGVVHPFDDRTELRAALRSRR